jgi:hypothetical protein
MNDNLIMNIPPTRDHVAIVPALYMRKWAESSHNTIHIDMTAIKGVSSRHTGASIVGGKCGLIRPCYYHGEAKLIISQHVQ